MASDCPSIRTIEFRDPQSFTSFSLTQQLNTDPLSNINPKYSHFLTRVSPSHYFLGCGSVGDDDLWYQHIVGMLCFFLHPPPGPPSCLRASQLAPGPSQMALEPSQLAPGPSQLALGPSQLALSPSQLALRPFQLAPRLTRLNPRPSQRCSLLRGLPNGIQGPPGWL